jgi:hypothetical protein
MTENRGYPQNRCTYTFPLPWWMSPDQEDPCRCERGAGHDDDLGHLCEHTTPKASEVTP